jgi:hypothetical protein
MPTDEAELAELRQANEHYAADYERRLAAEIVAMLPDRSVRGLRTIADPRRVDAERLPSPGGVLMAPPSELCDESYCAGNSVGWASFITGGGLHFPVSASLFGA